MPCVSLAHNLCQRVLVIVETIMAALGALIIFLLWAPLSVGHNIVGGWGIADKNSKDLQDLAAFCVSQFNANSAGYFLAKMISFEDAFQQVVAGMNYNLTIVLVQTQCKKNSNNPPDCDKPSSKNKINPPLPRLPTTRSSSVPRSQSIPDLSRSRSATRDTNAPGTAGSLGSSDTRDAPGSSSTPDSTKISKRTPEDNGHEDSEDSQVTVEETNMVKINPPLPWLPTTRSSSVPRSQSIPDLFRSRSATRDTNAPGTAGSLGSSDTRDAPGSSSTPDSTKISKRTPEDNGHEDSEDSQVTVEETCDIDKCVCLVYDPPYKNEKRILSSLKCVDL